ncbi:hypothetical protein ABZV67_43120 [Streptomyces sp. NPDC005065]|uniref:hypothetical protein n=1 Tax=Streptomyces sp. NPDC005065 TaxID=3154461 RepID=UPI00339EB2BE
MPAPPGDRSSGHGRHTFLLGVYLAITSIAPTFSEESTIFARVIGGTKFWSSRRCRDSPS